MSLSRADVEKVSLLARLRLTESELESMTIQMGRILEYVTLLDSIDTSQVEPLTHAVELGNVLVDDQQIPSLDRSAALAVAPKHDEECFLVPAVLGD